MGGGEKEDGADESLDAPWKRRISILQRPCTFADGMGLNTHKPPFWSQSTPNLEAHPNYNTPRTSILLIRPSFLALAPRCPTTPRQTRVASAGEP